MGKKIDVDDESSLSNRIKICISRFGSYNDFSEVTGISESTLHNYTSGSSEPKHSALIEIAKAADVNPYWIASGKGDMTIRMDLNKNDQNDNDTGVAERIRFCISENGGYSSFAERCNMATRTLNNYTSGISEPKTSGLLQISEAANVNFNWLATGIGDIDDPKSAPTAAKFLKYLYIIGKKERPSSNIEQGEVAGGRSNGETDIILLPTMSVTASAGGGSAIHKDEIKGHIGFDRAWLNSNIGLPISKLVSLSSVGDSMEPTINAGEMLLVSQAEQHMNPGDGIYIIRLEGDILVKRLQRLPGSKLKISSDNTIYGSYEIKLDEGTEFEVLGKVILVHGVRKV